MLFMSTSKMSQKIIKPNIIQKIKTKCIKIATKQIEFLRYKKLLNK